MSKRSQVSIIIVVLLLALSGAYFVYRTSHKDSIQSVTYLVSEADPTKYCNGTDMDSVGYKKTINIEKSTNTLDVNPTKLQIIKAIINSATTGMCQSALSQLDIKEAGGTVYIPPIDGWAGISIAMCSCTPQVETNLLRIPGITRVVWNSPDTSLPAACTQEAKICPDGSSVGRTGANCEFAPCPQAGILPFDSGVEGMVTLGPTCPVMRVGDTTCEDKPYATTIQVIAIGSPKNSPFATVNSDKEGVYKIMLPPGKYALQPIGGSVFPRCETKNIVISPAKVIQVDLSCDTGIR